MSLEYQLSIDDLRDTDIGIQIGNPLGYSWYPSASAY